MQGDLEGLSESEISLKSVLSVFRIKIRVERLEFRDHGRHGSHRCHR